MDWLDLLAVQGTLKNLIQHHSLKASILRHSAFFTVQLSHPYMTTGKTISLTRQTFVGEVMSLLFNSLSRFEIAFLLRSKCILISWLQSLSVVILEPKKSGPSKAGVGQSRTEQAAQAPDLRCQRAEPHPLGSCHYHSRMVMPTVSTSSKRSV